MTAAIMNTFILMLPIANGYDKVIDCFWTSLFTNNRSSKGKKYKHNNNIYTIRN